MTINTETVAQEVIDAIKQKIENLNTLNIIVAGKTGVGKSTLINAVFRDKLAETGLGKPVTTYMRRISKKGVPLNIYDTRGFELGKEVQQQVKKEVVEAINNGLAQKNINEAIHCIWYCINTASNRVEPEEIEWLRELAEENRATDVPIIIVLTQSFSKKNATELRKVLLNENLNVVQIVPVLAEDYEIDDEYIAKSYGLDVLIHVMSESLPEELMETLQNVQIVSLEEKKQHAQAVVASASLAAVAVGATPIPFADCALLIPTQVAMITSITVIFGFDVNKSVITAILSSTLGTGGATLLGKTVVSSILKLIPVVGSIAGGTISGGTAGVITAALGEAYVGVMELVFKGKMNITDLGSQEGKDKMVALFKEGLKRGKDNHLRE